MIINVECSVEKNNCRIKITNVGQLSSDELKFKFKPYYKDKESPSEGLHLGLSIAKAWIDNIGGKISIENSDERHVTASVLWPILI